MKNNLFVTPGLQVLSGFFAVNCHQAAVRVRVVSLCKPMWAEAWRNKNEKIHISGVSCQFHASFMPVSCQFRASSVPVSSQFRPSSVPVPSQSRPSLVPVSSCRFRAGFVPVVRTSGSPSHWTWFWIHSSLSELSLSLTPSFTWLHTSHAFARASSRFSRSGCSASVYCRIWSQHRTYDRANLGQT